MVNKVAVNVWTQNEASVAQLDAIDFEQPSWPRIDDALPADLGAHQTKPQGKDGRAMEGIEKQPGAEFSNRPRPTKMGGFYTSSYRARQRAAEDDSDPTPRAISSAAPP